MAALVRNAKAKIIERRFNDVKNGLSRLFNTYTGGSVVEKPERLKYVLKKDAIYTDDEFQEYVDAILKYYFNMMEYDGPVAEDKGKLKMDVFNEHLIKRRVAAAEELNLMLMRSSRPQAFRYNPNDLKEVRIYNLEDKYLMTVPVDNTAVLTYGATKDDVKAGMAVTRKLEKIANEYKKNVVIAEADRVTALDLVLRQAQRNKESYTGKADPKVLEVQRADETPVYQKVVGGVDLDTMIENAAKRQGGK